jgi:hypothetical protein
VPWFKVDDGWWSHPKTLELSGDAQALWLRAGSWAAGHSTDGFVPAAAMVMLQAKAKNATELVKSGLWDAVKGGYQFHDWLKYQPSKQQVESERAANAERQKKWRDSRKGNAVTNGDTNGTPSRPVPTQIDIAHPRQASAVANAHDSDDDPTVVAAQSLGIKSLSRVRSAFGDLLDAEATDGEVIDAATAVLDRSRTFVTSPEAYIEKAVKESRHEVGLYAQDAQARSPRRTAVTA